MERILEKILSELQALHEGQARLESNMTVLRKDVVEIKSELRYVWGKITP